MTAQELPKVLLVEDSASNALVYQSYLKGKCRVLIAENGQSALDLLTCETISLLITDVRLPDMSGMDILDHVRSSIPSIPVIVITAFGSVDLVVDAMRRGATDFLSKPFDKARLEVTVTNILKRQHLQYVVDEYQKTFERDRFHQMIGASLPMQGVYRIIESCAASKASVFITGESGTGKELCSEALHEESNRSGKPFVAINCAAIPRELIESEVFGHVKGAFTGAASAREGAALRASGGTLFLDEIGEMPMDLQSKLLRFIQSGTFSPVGSSKEIKVDVRFICATNRDPLLEVREGRFREDLYYRLHVIPLHMPPLRERGKDVLQLAGEFLQQYSKDENKSFRDFDACVCDFFMKYSWPGNVRELSNVIRNIVVLNEGATVLRSMLPSTLAQSADGLGSSYNSAQLIYANSSHSNHTPETDTLETDTVLSSDPLVDMSGSDSTDLRRDAGTILPLWKEERRIIESAIEKCGGNIPRAAALLEISASTIYRKKQGWEKSASKPERELGSL
ncbi:sigma-54-dependent transcriptional regulator [Marinobacter sp. CA1]|uniref:sigma-54-dependent transcriptional regulator n=1 Tax=Marinobacter sp. CA1 TaxID=2817656 RepID=UPI001D0949F3|nr:sigma-54 dependent transcriptional regulator [Marinobacter sp. CA1]UDL07043.1 sigma-54-dependent Fis family transcriptional regulator [Marinobacter sp. CA1]